MCSYPEPDRCSQCPHPTSRRSILTLSPIYAWVFEIIYFPQVSPLKPRIHLSPLPYMLHALPITVFVIRFPEIYLVRRIERKVLHYVCSLLLAPVSSSLLGPNILLRILFSKTVSLRSSRVLDLVTQITALKSLFQGFINSHPSCHFIICSSLELRSRKSMILQSAWNLAC
jgi:hypothetical protein